MRTNILVSSSVNMLIAGVFLFYILLSLDEIGESGTDIFGQHKSAIAPQDSSIRQVLETWEEKIRKKPLSKDKRRQLSENLLRAGFKQFAFEIMTGRIYFDTMRNY